MHHHGPGGAHWEERMKERQEMIQNIKEMKDTIDKQINAVQSENEEYKGEIATLRKEIEEMKKVIRRQDQQINEFRKESEIIRDYIPDGYGDIRFSVKGEEIEGVKCIICAKNQTLNSLINDEKGSSVIPIEEKVSMNSFKMLLSYYGYGKIILDDDNVSNLLYCCLCYNEINLGNKCKEYILNNLSVELVMNLLLNVDPSLIESDTGEFKIQIESYIRDNSVKLLSEAKSLSLPIEILDYINSISDLLEQSNGFSLQNIMKYYNDTIKSLCEKKEEKLLSKIKELSDLLDDHFISYNKLNEEEMKISVESDLQSFVTNCNTILFARSYLDIPMPSNNESSNLIADFYSRDTLPSELREEEKSLLKNCNDLKECLINLLKKDNQGLKLSLLIVIDCGVDIDIDEKTRFLSEYKLMSEFLESKRESDKNLCCKCLCYFIDKKETLDNILKICGKDMIEKMKFYSSSLPETPKAIIQSY